MHKRPLAIGIAVVIAVGLPAQPVGADANSVPTLGYGRQKFDKVQSSTWSGSSWKQVSDSRSVGAEPTWVVLRNCPTRNEFALVTLDQMLDVNLQFRANGGWSGLTELCTNAGTSDTRAFDAAYEQLSGKLLVAYWEDEWPAGPRYRTYDGASLSAERSLALPNKFRATWLKLVARKNSNIIMLLALNSSLDLFAAFWDGSNFGSVAQLHDNCSYSNYECFDGAFESLSGEALVVYTSSGSRKPRYRTWNGKVWSSDRSLPSVGSNQRWLRLAADPTSDQVLFACLDDAQDINTNTWNGSSWSKNRELETKVSQAALRAFDLAYEPAGTKGLMVYSQSSDKRVRYRTWSGAAWSAEKSGAKLQRVPTLVQLATGQNAGEIFAAILDEGRDLSAMRWNGSTFSPPQGVASTMAAPSYECFMLAPPCIPPALFADVSTLVGFNVPSSDDPDWGSGLYWGDLDNDGDLDAVVTGNNSSMVLSSNNAGQTFTRSVFGGGSIYRQGALLDVDNDGDLDFWGLPRSQRETLFINDGRGAFADAGDSGFSEPDNNEAVAAADVDNDGRCDVVMFSENGNWIGRNRGAAPIALAGTSNQAYGLNDAGDYGNGDYCSSGDVNNDGWLDFFYHYGSGKLFLSDSDGSYTENNCGISITTGTTRKIGSAWADYDNDRDLDLFVARYDGSYRGYLWKNRLSETGALAFTDVAAAAGITDVSGQRGCCWGDYDNDGDLDLYIVTRSGGANVLYQNQGPPGWSFRAVNVGAAAPGDGQDAVFVDYDNDGDLDLAVTQTSVRGKNTRTPGTAGPANRLAGAIGSQSQYPAGNTLLRNGTNNENYLKVRVGGGGTCGTNAAAVGATIELWDAQAATFLARRDIGVARGFAGGEPLWAHFGGLNSALTYTVKVRFAGGWSATRVVPGSVSTTIGGRIIPRMLTVQESQTQAVFTDVSLETGFNVRTSVADGSGLHWGDLDNDGDLDAIVTGDGSSRLLINNGGQGLGFVVSDFGGGNIFRQGALFDVDNDGDLDFWGLPSRQSEKLFTNNGAGAFTDAGPCGFDAPSENEGLAAADVNADGYCDLVMFGGEGNWIGYNQSGETPSLTGSLDRANGLNDAGDSGDGDYCSSGDVNNDGRPDFFYHYGGGKLFISDADGTYTQSNFGISVTTGDAVKIGSAWGDFDNDGDLDLFVPRYTAGQTGSLWRNDVNWTARTGTFTNVTTAAGITDESGQRGSCWGDYDNDGDLDLYIVTHSGAANVLYRNQGDGAFVAACAGADAPGSGMDACFADFDNDGDLDLAVTQQGRNNTLLRNNTNRTAYLKVRLVGQGGGGTNLPGLGTRVELWDAAGTTRLARRDVGGARGYGGMEPLWVHFGGVISTNTYTVKAYFGSLPIDEPYATTCVPAGVWSAIGDTIVQQMLTIEEPRTAKIIQWREVPNRAGS